MLISSLEMEMLKASSDAVELNEPQSWADEDHFETKKYK